jgi:predicted glycogen debranching enzyme
MVRLTFGREVCGSLPEASDREWLVADGLGGFAMGTVGALRTRRYHGLLVVATKPPIGRMLGLASVDPFLVVGDRRIGLATHEWVGGAVDPSGYLHLAAFELTDGVPRWRWSIGDVVIEREVAMLRGRPAVAVVHRVIRSPSPVRLELDVLATWRDADGERFDAGDGPPLLEPTADGFVFEDTYRVSGPGFEPGGWWYRGARYRVEAERGLNDHEDLFYAGKFVADGLRPGDAVEVTAWAGDLAAAPPPAARVVDAARARARDVATKAKPADGYDALLAVAADQFVVDGPMVVAGYPWFGDWSRDTMTSYEGLFLATNRWDEGRELLLRAADSLSEGMLANTADFTGGVPEYNTADGTLWFLHAVGRHVEVTGDEALAAKLLPSLVDVIRWHVEGTRFGIRIDPTDGLVTQGANGVALTWMDARVADEVVTPRRGKSVEINALWIAGLATVAGFQELLGRDSSQVRALEQAARVSFARRFPKPDGMGLFDAVDGPTGDMAEIRPNQLLASSLPSGPLVGEGPVRACADLLTSVGLRSLSPADPLYRGHHRGDQYERDHAYHQGAVWPWFIGPYVEACQRTAIDTDGVLDGLEAHLGEWGLGSVSETLDGDEPHAATGCPFQAWSVAELLRARRLIAAM